MIVDTPVLPVVEELAETSKAFSQNRVQQSSIEQTIANPVISLAEKTVEMPVIRTQEKISAHDPHRVSPRKELREGVSSRSITVTNKSNSLTYTVASSIICTSPLAVITVVGLSDYHLMITIHTHQLSSVVMYTCAPATDHDLDSCPWLKVSLKNDHQTFDRRETG